jgi:hypothetical protein
MGFKKERLKVSRLEHITNLITDLVTPIIWVCDPKLDRGYFKIISIWDYLQGIQYDLECFIRGYIDVWAIEE